MFAQTHLTGVFEFLNQYADMCFIALGLGVLLSASTVIAAIGQRPIGPLLLPMLCAPAISCVFAVILGWSMPKSLDSAAFLANVPTLAFCVYIYFRPQPTKPPVILRH